MHPPYGSWVEISTATLEANARAIRAAVPGKRVIAIVKSDAYGHGIERAVEAFCRAGVDAFAVVYPAEAYRVRAAAGDRAKLILALGGALPEETPELLARDVATVVADAAQARAFSGAAKAAGGKLRVHVKLDTGMGRLGFLMPRDLPDAVSVAGMDGLQLEGICAHFAMVEPVRHPQEAKRQMEKFFSAADAIEKAAGRKLLKHVSSSRASLVAPEYDLDAIRPGIVLYGYGAHAAFGRYATAPAMQWKARIVQVRDVPEGTGVGYYAAYVTKRATKIAVASAGYADGYNRHLGNRGDVLVGGQRKPVAGRVSMNWICIDLGPDSDAKPGDEVVLLGTQGRESVWAGELAEHCGTIAYEILTGISKHLPRISV